MNNPSTTSTLRDTAAKGKDALETGKHALADAAAHAKSKVSDMELFAEKSLKSGRDSAGKALEKTEKKTKEMMSDLLELVEKNPGKSLAAAVAVGFLAARAVRN